MKCGDTTTQSIQNTDLELLASIGPQSFKSCSAGEGRHLLHLACEFLMYRYARLLTRTNVSPSPTFNSGRMACQSNTLMLDATSGAQRLRFGRANHIAM